MPHFLGLAGILYAVFVRFSWLTTALAVLWLILCVLSTTGYHRLLAHGTHRTTPGIRLFYLLFGAASGQGPALQWSSDQRLHHPANVRDLQADALLRLQKRFYLPLAALVGFILPTLVAWTWGDPVGGLLLAGFLRLAIQTQATFAINSVAHWIGRPSYATVAVGADFDPALRLGLKRGRP